MTNRTWWLALAAATLFAGCPEPADDDDVADDDATADDDTGDDDTTAGDDDTGDDDTTAGDDDDVADDDTMGDDDVADDVEGLVYYLDLPDGGFTFTEPPGVGVLLGMYMGQLPQDEGVIFSASAVQASSIEMLIGGGAVVNPNAPETSWVWEQTADLTSIATGTWSSPAFDVGPTDMEFNAGDVAVWLGDVQVSGSYNGDNSAVIGVELAGMADTVAFDELLGFDPGGLCDTLDGLGVPCLPCPPQSPHQGEFCIDVVAEGGTCPLLAGTAMVPVP